MKKCIVFSGGEIKNYNNLKIDKGGAYVICADAGYKHAVNLGIVPDLLIGDFDTLEHVPENVCEVIRLIPEKDDTDTMAAVRQGILRGCTDFTLYGALGGRLDHTFANLQVLSFIKSQGFNAQIISDNEIITLIENESINITKKNGYTLSLFCFGDECTGVTEKGVKYPLDNATLCGSYPLGVCNEITDVSADISVKCGKILIIQSKIQEPF